MVKAFVMKFSGHFPIAKSCDMSELAIHSQCNLSLHLENIKPVRLSGVRERVHWE